ncbi:hypothetical protein CC1G_13575 [Coprinopsis cinerea okayama7|uniref:Uncharacterized protein n=1 Tax=Coprinopsis cinerea (strain Okayama-7 / 130 / ATCC MYA-4618 / FGSC 9003) TaxID=240176 RepID=D6RJN6_COPC7|nr:hypothetical protein CC1G_13575 [Coprinopsis cinerea okayama7\|eukprot:XP_002912047.1 hypothetical protein CC1G_13575 [Coprinopsis cinerea okayama7\
MEIVIAGSRIRMHRTASYRSTCLSFADAAAALLPPFLWMYTYIKPFHLPLLSDRSGTLCSKNRSYRHSPSLSNADFSKPHLSQSHAAPILDPSQDQDLFSTLHTDQRTRTQS